MNSTEKIQYLRIALGLQKIGVNDEMAERIIATYETVLKLGGNFSIKDAVQIELKLDKKYKEKELTNS